MSRTRKETESYRITHYRITERNISVSVTRIVKSMGEINAVQHQGIIMNQKLCQTIILGVAKISVI